MKKVKSFTGDSKDPFMMTDTAAAYIYSDLYTFFTRHQTDILDERNINVEQGLIKEMTAVISGTLSKLLDDCYIQPLPSEVQAHSPRFERFVFRGIGYTVNYRMSCNGYGNVAFVLYHLVCYLKDLQFLSLEFGD
jgi:hypothetical protein